MSHVAIRHAVACAKNGTDRITKQLGFRPLSSPFGGPSTLIARIDTSHLATAMARGGMCYDGFVRINHLARQRAEY